MEGATCSSPKQATEFEMLLDRLKALGGRGNKNSSRLRENIDRLSGPIPCETTKGAPEQPPSNSIIGRFTETMNGIEHSIDATQQELDRLAKL